MNLIYTEISFTLKLTKQCNEVIQLVIAFLLAYTDCNITFSVVVLLGTVTQERKLSDAACGYGNGRLEEPHSAPNSKANLNQRDEVS